IDDPGADMLAEPGRIGDRDRLLRGKADAGYGGALHLRRADMLALAEQGARLPGGKAPFHEAARFLDPLVEAGQPGDDHHEAPAVADRGAGEAVARLFGMAGLQAIGAGDDAQQRVAIVLADGLVAAHRPPPGEVPEPVIMLVELGIVAER